MEDLSMSAPALEKRKAKNKQTLSDQQKPHKELRTFKSKGAIPYDSCILSCHVSEKMVATWTVQGRRLLPFSMGLLQEELLGYQRLERIADDASPDNGVRAVMELTRPAVAGSGYAPDAFQ